MCSGSIIGGRSTPEGCCLPSVSGGFGAGSYAVDGDPQCFNCTGIVGENDLSMIISTSVKIIINHNQKVIRGCAQPANTFHGDFSIHSNGGALE